eukprot:634772-Prymnesium_polylepis.1
MTLEDDVELAPDFFARLPQVLAHLPDGPWHALRFSTWNELWEPDRVPATSLYKVKYVKTGMPPFTLVGPGVEHPKTFYGGAHATLFQRSTAREMLDHMLACGAGCPDVEGYADLSGLGAPAAAARCRLS